MKIQKLIARLAALLIAVFCINCTAVFAYEFPQSFWEPNKKFSEALSAKDYQGIIKYGKELISIMEAAPNGAERRQVLASRNREVAVAYTTLGDSQNAYTHYKKLYDLVSQYPNELADWKYIAETGVDRYKSEIAVYTDKGTAPYFGAKNEKKNGVLFGTNSDGATRANGGLENESMMIIYQEVGRSLLPIIDTYMKEAAQKGLAVEFALNCPNEAADVNNIKSMEWSLAEVSAVLAKYPSVPVYLRFAAEFDVWGSKPDAETFKNSFIYVAQYFRSRHSNVAIVWSPNQVSSYEFDLDAYYPGDAYVDWVGMSSYALKYYQSDKSRTQLENMFFKTGKNSNPVIAVREIVEKYGSRKPIMISESGSTHYVYNGVNENTTDFALQRMKEYYAYLPMVYPQIKLIAHFDQYLAGTDNDFRLSSNSAVKNEYIRLTKGESFIQNSYNGSAGLTYRKIVNGTNVDSIFMASCFAYINGVDIESVVYYIDGKYAGMSDELPFTTYIDASGYSGQHTLKAVAKGKNGTQLTNETKININNENKNITVKISGNKVEFDQQPVLYNSRTMVPLRKIFEALGATVSWDDATQTATGTRGTTVVKVTVGSKKIYVNGKEVSFDVPAIILSGRTLVPARAVAEGLGCDVGWDDATSTVLITPKG